MENKYIISTGWYYNLKRITMYNITKTPGTTVIRRREAVAGEMLEHKVERIVSNKEPIKDGAPLLYVERGEGVKASTNIRTDRWEIAIDATENIAKSYKARREERAKMPKDGETKPLPEAAATGSEPKS